MANMIRILKKISKNLIKTYYYLIKTVNFYCWKESFNDQIPIIISRLFAIYNQIPLISTSHSIKSKSNSDQPSLGITKDSRPHIRVIDIQPDSFEETSLDAVAINDYARNRSCDYRLDFIAEDGLFFIIGPKDIIKAIIYFVLFSFFV